jgi:hypothetical protein
MTTKLRLSGAVLAVAPRPDWGRRKVAVAEHTSPRIPFARGRAGPHRIVVSLMVACWVWIATLGFACAPAAGDVSQFLLPGAPEPPVEYPPITKFAAGSGGAWWLGVGGLMHVNLNDETTVWCPVPRPDRRGRAGRSTARKRAVREP